MACDASPLTPRDVLLEFLRTFVRERHLAEEIDILRVRLDELADCLQVVYTRHGLTGVYGYSECGLTNVIPRTGGRPWTLLLSCMVGCVTSRRTSAPCCRRRRVSRPPPRGSGGVDRGRTASA